jgi:3-oxoadipate enol-lactonase
MASRAVRLHVEAIGSGPGLCFLHGFGGSARNFRPQLRAFRNSCRVVAFDARGHARSEAPPLDDDYEIEAFVDDIGRVLDSTNLRRPVLCGVSMGAALALRFAIERPNDVSAIVLAAIPSGDSAAAWALPFAEAIETRGLEAAGASFVWGGARFDRGAAELIRKGFMEHEPRALSAILRRVIARLPDVAEMEASLGRCPVPILFIAGSEDGPSRLATERLAGVAPASRSRIVAGAGHVVNLQAPAEFNESMALFISDLS